VIGLPGSSVLDGEGPGGDADRASLPQGACAGVERGAGGRDVVHDEDGAAANLAVSELSISDPETIDDVAFNVATGNEVSVCQLAETLLSVAGQQADIEFAAARQGELLRSSLDTARLRAAGWAPEIDLTQGLGRTYEYIAEHL